MLSVSLPGFSLPPFPYNSISLYMIYKKQKADSIIICLLPGKFNTSQQIDQADPINADRVLIFSLFVVYLYYTKLKKTKGGDCMPTNEKEYNGYLFDQLSILERIEAVTDDEKVLKQIAIERRQIERKLYQQPPLINE